MGIKCKVTPVSNLAPGKMYEEVEEELHILNFRTRWWVVSFVLATKVSQKTKFVLKGMVHPLGCSNRETNVNLLKSAGYLMNQQV